MAPPQTPQEELPEQSQEYLEFVDSLTKFATDRGINVDFATRVAGKHIDLYKLYSIITAQGGYDAVSEQKLGWRRIGVEFALGNTNAAAYAFALKTAYYRNLAAYEIKHIHGKEPPPTEILEKLTAKGADILNRTTENFKVPQKRLNLANGASESESEDAQTPKEDKMDVDDPTSAGSRSTRGLRQQPPQRVLFQPEVSSSRPIRHSSGHLQSPQPSNATMATTGYNYSGTPISNNTAFSIANYEPKPQMPLTLRPVLTPGNNYPQFQLNVKTKRDAKRARLGLMSPASQGVMKPGAGFEGPNIYVRTLQGLRSPLPEEQEYALHHLVKISHERGDKYKFEAFPGLAEGLLEFVLGISSLFYDIRWEICFTQEQQGINIIDGIKGTPDMLSRIESLRRIDTPDELESEQFGRKLTKFLEAGLTIRNLALLEDNAQYLADMPQLRDFLSIALNLPSLTCTTEMKHYALDIAEQVTRYWRMSPSDPLYESLLAQVADGHDRGAILTSLRAICRISMNLEDSNLLEGVPIAVIQRVFEWLILDDEELVASCLDFLYQYTAVPENVRLLLENADELSLRPFCAQVTRLLQFKAVASYTKLLASDRIPGKPAQEIPSVPKDLMEQFSQYEEPVRSNHWLRSVFEEDPTEHITQIALWSAYQKRFTEFASQSQLLPAAEFIKNVSTIFSGANAQVIVNPTQRFIIKGIRPRHAPMDQKGRVYSRCLWKRPGSEPCSEFFLKPKLMFEHVARNHLGIERQPDGLWQFDSPAGQTQPPSDCFWAGCRHFAKQGGPPPSPYEIGMHVKTHLPDISNKSVLRQKHNRTPATQHTPLTEATDRSNLKRKLDLDDDQSREATYQQSIWWNTVVDELGNAAGLPLTSVLVLRNMARNVPKATALMGGSDNDELRISWMEELFGTLRERLLYVIAFNRPLSGYVYDVLGWIEKGRLSE